MKQDQIQSLNEKVTKAIGGKLNIGPNIFWILPNVGNIQFDEWTPATDLRDAMFAAEKAGLLKNGILIQEPGLVKIYNEYAFSTDYTEEDTLPVAICKAILKVAK